VLRGAEVPICRSCFLATGSEAPGIKSGESLLGTQQRMARGEAAVAGEPSEMERHMASKAAESATKDLLQMKKDLEADGK
jgi:hypothetical protein